MKKIEKYYKFRDYLIVNVKAGFVGAGALVIYVIFYGVDIGSGDGVIDSKMYLLVLSIFVISEIMIVALSFLLWRWEKGKTIYDNLSILKKIKKGPSVTVVFFCFILLAVSLILKFYEIISFNVLFIIFFSSIFLMILGLHNYNERNNSDYNKKFQQSQLYIFFKRLTILSLLLVAWTFVEELSNLFYGTVGPLMRMSNKATWYVFATAGVTLFFSSIMMLTSRKWFIQSKSKPNKNKNIPNKKF